MTMASACASRAAVWLVSKVIVTGPMLVPGRPRRSRPLMVGAAAQVPAPFPATPGHRVIARAGLPAAGPLLPGRPGLVDAFHQGGIAADLLRARRQHDRRGQGEGQDAD